MRRAYLAAPRRMSAHVQDRLPSLRKLMRQVARRVGESAMELAQESKAELAQQRARQADFFYALSEGPAQ